MRKRKYRRLNPLLKPQRDNCYKDILAVLSRYPDLPGRDKAHVVSLVKSVTVKEFMKEYYDEISREGQ